MVRDTVDHNGSAGHEWKSDTYFLPDTGVSDVHPSCRGCGGPALG